MKTIGLTGLHDFQTHNSYGHQSELLKLLAPRKSSRLVNALPILEGLEVRDAVNGWVLRDLGEHMEMSCRYSLKHPG